MINANLVFQHISNYIDTKANHVSHGQHANNAMNVIFSIWLFSLGNLVETCMESKLGCYFGFKSTRA